MTVDSAVCLVPADERTHVVGWQQRHPVSAPLGNAPPVVRRAARFHHDPARRPGRQPGGVHVSREGSMGSAAGSDYQRRQRS